MSDILQWQRAREKRTTEKSRIAGTSTESMLRPGLAKKVTVHLNEDTASRRDFLYNEILSFLYHRGVAGASVLRPDAGFGAHHRLHQSEHGHAAAEHMPVRIEFIDTPERVATLLPELCELMSDGLIEAHDTTVYKAAASGAEQVEHQG